MSYQHLIIDKDDKSKFDSLVDGSVVAASTHSHLVRSTVRTVTSSGDIVPGDENNIIHVSASRTGVVVLTPTVDVTLIDGFSFRVRVENNNSYTVRIPISGGDAMWEFNGYGTEKSMTYSFNIDGSGHVVPENSKAISDYAPS